MDWLSGYPVSVVQEGYAPGVISPVSGTLTLPHLQQQTEFSIQVSFFILHNEAEIYLPVVIWTNNCMYTTLHII